MRALNKFMKAIAMIPIHLIVLIYSWILSFITTAGIATAVGFIWSLLTALPAAVLTEFWLIYLIATIPFTLVFFIVIETGRVKEDSAEQWKKRLGME